MIRVYVIIRVGCMKEESFIKELDRAWEKGIIRNVFWMEKSNKVIQEAWSFWNRPT